MGTTEQEIRRERLRRMKEQDRINEEAVAAMEAQHDEALGQADALDAEMADEAETGEATTARKSPAKKSGKRR